MAEKLLLGWNEMEDDKVKQGIVLIVFIVAFAAFLASPPPILAAHGTATMQNHDRKVMIIQVPKPAVSDDFQIVGP